MFAGVNGEHGEAGREAGVNVAGRLQVVGVGAEPVAEPLLQDAPGHVVHDLLGRAARAGHLADGLLRQEDLDARAAHGADVSGRGDAQAVARPDGAAKAHHVRRGEGQVRSQAPRVASTG